MNEQMTVKARNPRTLQGVVVSDKMNKTRVIEIRRRVSHQFYHKSILKRSRFFVHDEKNESKVGDLVLASSTRPRSLRKSFQLVKILEKKVGE